MHRRASRAEPRRRGSLPQRRPASTNCTYREAVCRYRQVVLFLRNPKRLIKIYLNIFSAHFSLFRNVIYTVRQYHVTDYRVDFSNFVLCHSKRVENSTTRATMCSPVLHVRIRVGLLREETSALDSDCRKCIQSRALVPFRVSAHSRETERHKRCFG